MIFLLLQVIIFCCNVLVFISLLLDQVDLEFAAQGAIRVESRESDRRIIRQNFPLTVVVLHDTVLRRLESWIAHRGEAITVEPSLVAIELEILHRPAVRHQNLGVRRLSLG